MARQVNVTDGQLAMWLDAMDGDHEERGEVFLEAVPALVAEIKRLRQIIAAHVEARGVDRPSPSEGE